MTNIRFFKSDDVPSDLKSGDIVFDSNLKVIRIITDNGIETYGIESAVYQDGNYILSSIGGSSITLDLSMFTKASEFNDIITTIKNYTVNGIEIYKNPVIPVVSNTESGLMTPDQKLIIDVLTTGSDGQILMSNNSRPIWVNYDGGGESTEYGVEWKPDVKDPQITRVGNENYHKTLPIQSAMKGCVYNAKEKRVVYWLDGDDWKYKEGGNPTKGETEQLSRLDGYDGEVMVYVPSFWIKSSYETDRRWVRISTKKIDDTWEYQPAVFISAYRETILNTVPENMGYLSTLEANTAVSIANNSDYCIGADGPNGSSTVYDDVLRGKPGKCRTGILRSTYRTYTRQGNKEILSYRQYKNIFYWLWVIEHATFNSSQDGGLINMQYWDLYNDNNPIVPNGFTNEYGNGTAIKTFTLPAFDSTIPAIHKLWGVKVNSTNGAVDSHGRLNITNITSTDDATFYFSYKNISVKTLFGVYGLTDSGETIIFECEGKIIGELSADGDILIEWPHTVSVRNVKFSAVKSNVDITISILAGYEGTINVDEQTLQSYRWRGFEDPFGHMPLCVDGVVIDRDYNNHTDKMIYVYTTDKPNDYGDSLTNTDNMVLSGKQKPYNAWIKEFDLGSTSEIIPKDTAWTADAYRCDWNLASSSNTNPSTLLLGGSASDGNKAGLCHFSTTSHYGQEGSYRSVVVE